MRIAVEGIPAAGRLVDFTGHDDWAQQAATRSLDAPPQAFEGSMMIQLVSKRAGLVRVEGAVKAEAPADCDRCGESCGLHLDERFTLLFAPEETGTDAFDGGEIQLEVDELDLGWYRNGALELADVLREAVALALPVRVTCADVAQCDRRTDRLLAAHAAKPGHPAFQALQGLTGTDSDA